MSWKTENTKKIYEIILSNFRDSDKIKNERWFLFTREETVEFVYDVISNFKVSHDCVRFLKGNIDKQVDITQINYQLTEDRKVLITFGDYLLTATELDVQEKYEKSNNGTSDQTDLQDLEQFDYTNLDKSKEELCDYLTTISVGAIHKLDSNNKADISAKEIKELTPFLLQIGFAIIIILLENAELAMNSIDINNIDFDKFVKYIFDKLNLDFEEIQQFEKKEKGLM